MLTGDPGSLLGRAKFLFRFVWGLFYMSICILSCGSIQLSKNAVMERLVSWSSVWNGDNSVV